MRTLKSSFKIKGVGLMSGVQFEVEVKPASSKGIYFSSGDKKVKATLENVVSADHCVVIANVLEGASLKVALIEHFMAACAVSRLDSVEMVFPDIPAPAFEVPILDGSSKIWVEEFNKVGFEGAADKAPELTAPVTFQKGKSAVIIMPSEEDTKITYAVNFNHPELNNRWTEMVQSLNLNEIVEARTFGYLKDLETFQKMGLSKGVTIDNTVGMTDDGFTTSLRSPYEPNKHKILDIIGDLYLTGINPLDMKANIIVKEAGHALHIEAAKLLNNCF